MKDNCTGVILAGGLNSRLPGKKKAFHRVGELTILETIYNTFSSIFPEIIIVVNDPLDFMEWDLEVVRDMIPSKCALAGLHAGLFHASSDYIYVTACDTPFVSKRVIEYMVDQIRPEFEVIIPETEDGIEALSAVYAKSCIPLIEKNLEKNIFMIKKFFRKKKVRQIPVQRLRKLDPELDFIFNINTPKDLETARMIALNQDTRPKSEKETAT